jgi:hypothetical protein
VINEDLLLRNDRNNPSSKYECINYQVSVRLVCACRA